MKNPQSAIVIGAGVAGLATAGLLARAGMDVTVVEKNQHVGGRADEITVDGFRFETGPSWYLMPEAFDHFFELMGTSTAAELDLQLLDPGYRVYTEGFAPVDVPQGTERVAELFEVIEPGAGAAIREYLDSAADVYQVALDRFLYTTFAAVKPLLHKDVTSRLLTLAVLLTESLKSYVDRRFTDPRLRQILQYPAVFLSSQPKKAPSMYHLMSHTDLNLGVQYPQGGFTSIVRALERLARAHGARIITGAEVTQIRTAGKKATGVRMLHDGHPATLEADIVVAAGDLEHTEAHLLPKKLRTYSAGHFNRTDPGLGVVLALLGVQGELPELLHHTLMFSREWDDDFAVVYDGPQESRPEGSSYSIYVCKPSATDPSVAPEGYENLFVLIPVAPDESLGHGDAYGHEESAKVAAIVDQAITQIGDWAGIADFRDRITVKRSIGPADFARRYFSFSAGAIGPAHILRQSAFLRGSNKSKKVEGLYYAGQTTVPGVGVPMCLISAENVVKRVYGRTDTEPMESLDG
ncbi:phytoene desaturase family protein [Corynebacterium renale]|uniref:phytoene desaturase family protein n=1 Tax=Corynebacterium renale TaxID=1724 RepID=UPI000E070512|nr:phytoene desaturase family protein [Corynebacterium renale]STC99723.1 phytoene dehydrogenase [Corynebacterium renale]